MKYLAIYTVTYTTFLVVGWLSPNVPAAAVVGVSHLCGLLAVLGWRLCEITEPLNRQASYLKAAFRVSDPEKAR